MQHASNNHRSSADQRGDGVFADAILIKGNVWPYLGVEPSDPVKSFDPVKSPSLMLGFSPQALGDRAKNRLDQLEVE